MDRRRFLADSAKLGCLAFLGAVGCRGTQHAHVLNPNEQDMVGSHTAGAETWEPLIQQTVGQLLGRQHSVIVTAGNAADPMAKKRICFAGVENKSAEELGDFREQMYEKIDTCINESEEFEVITRRFVEAGLKDCQLRPEDLFVPSKQRLFTATMEKANHPFDYLLFAKVTSGTTKSNGKDYQRDYLLTLELINIESGKSDKESAEIRKGYHKSKLGKMKHYGAG